MTLIICAALVQTVISYNLIELSGALLLFQGLTLSLLNIWDKTGISKVNLTLSYFYAAVSTSEVGLYNGNYYGH